MARKKPTGTTKKARLIADQAAALAEDTAPDRFRIAFTSSRLRTASTPPSSGWGSSSAKSSPNPPSGPRRQRVDDNVRRHHTPGFSSFRARKRLRRVTLERTIEPSDVESMPPSRLRATSRATGG
jgi:hypothetical protein